MRKAIWLIVGIIVLGIIALLTPAGDSRPPSTNNRQATTTATSTNAN